MPIEIEQGFKCPTGRFNDDTLLGQLRTAIANMKPSTESFLWPSNKLVYDAAKQTGIKVTTRKLNNGMYRVWRVK